MKALEILRGHKALWEELGVENDTSFDEAIVELESLEARIAEYELPKSCDGCKWDYDIELNETHRDRAIHANECGGCKRSYRPDRYEPKGIE